MSRRNETGGIDQRSNKTWPLSWNDGRWNELAGQIKHVSQDEYSKRFTCIAMDVDLFRPGNYKENLNISLNSIFEILH